MDLQEVRDRATEWVRNDVKPGFNLLMTPECEVAAVNRDDDVFRVVVKCELVGWTGFGVITEIVKEIEREKKGYSKKVKYWVLYMDDDGTVLEYGKGRSSGAADPKLGTPVDES